MGQTRRGALLCFTHTRKSTSKGKRKDIFLKKMKEPPSFSFSEGDAGGSRLAAGRKLQKIPEMGDH